MVLNRQVGPVGPRPAGTAVLTPKDIFGILRRHILMIVSMTVLGLIIGGVSWYLLLKYYPKYTAQTTIKVLPPVEKDPTTIGGAQVAKDIQYGSRLSMAAIIKQQSTLENLLKRDKVRETNWFRSFGEIKDKRITKAVRDLKKHFGAHAQRDGDYIAVSMTCGDKEEAALIVNEMVTLFLASQGRTKKEDITARLAGLAEQRIRVQRDVDSAERALDDVRKRWKITDLEQRYFQNTITLRLNDLELQENELTLTISQIQASIGTLERQATGPINEQVEDLIENDPTVVMLTRQIVSLEASLAGRLTKFGENHRVVREIQEQINETRDRRASRRAEIAEQTRQANFKNAQDQLIVLLNRLEQLKKMRQEATAQKRDLDLARVQYGQRVDIRDERKQMLDSVKAQIEKLKMMYDDPETPKVKFAGMAPAPLEVSSPKWKIYFPGGMMLGLMFGIGFAFLVEMLNDLVRTPRDVGRFLHIPLLGVIPDAAEDDQQTHGIDLSLIVRQAPYSIISESYRRFRTNLKLSSSSQSVKAVLVSSGAPGDGKTSVAVNLATTFVAESKKVLLIDANFWRPGLHAIFPRQQVRGEGSGFAEESQGEVSEAGGQSEFGLSTLLTGLCGYQEVIRSSGIEGFDIIDSGPLPANPAELLGAEQMNQLLKHQRECYDYIIVDGPPVLLVSDVKTLARVVDGTVLVFNAGATRRGAALRTIRELREVNATIVGCVLFAVKAMKGGYFTEQFKSYQEYQKPQLAHST